jgi:hypothetical protein
MGLTSLHGRMPPATCQRCEVLGAVTMEGDTPAEPSPTDADLVQGLRPGPLHEGLFADLQQRRTTPLALGTHDMHAPLVVFAGVAAAKVEREFFYLFARLRVEGDLPYRHPAVVAGVGMVLILILSGWVRVGYARLIHVNLLSRLAGSRGAATPAGPFTL